MKRQGITKDIIFDVSVALFAKSGYETVSMRDIAQEVGIKPASIYNHYEGKQQILDHIYDYYLKHIEENRPTEQEMREIIRSGTREEIGEGFTRNSFPRMGEQKALRLILITKILYMRIFHDPTARDIYRQMNDYGINYITKALDYGVEIGRFAPFDTRGYAYSFVAQYIAMGVDAFISPDYQPTAQPLETAIIDRMTGLLPMIEKEKEPIY